MGNLDPAGSKNAPAAAAAAAAAPAAAVRPQAVKKRYNPGAALCKALQRLRDRYVSCCISASEKGDFGHLVYGSAVYSQPDVVGRCSVDRRGADDDVARISTDWAGDFLSESARRACMTPLADKSPRNTPSKLAQRRNSFSRIPEDSRPVHTEPVRSSFS